MANPKNKVASNTSGAWYVDEECIDCDLCRTTAPENFVANEDDGYSFVYHQPVDETQLALCQQALEECPVEAIGNDADASGGAVDHLVHRAPATTSTQQATPITRARS